MASLPSSSHLDSNAHTRAPFFTGSDYPMWKFKMLTYLQATDLDVWDCIEDGPKIPSKLVDGVLVPKSKHEWDEIDRKNFQISKKAIYVLICSIDRNELNRVTQCKSARDIWRLLEVTHEGTNQVKETKINILVHSYELFTMKDNEPIVEMFTRFTEIVNGLEALGKTYKESEKVMKILRSLPKKWEAKVTAIQEAKDLTKLPLEELMGSLMTHEITMKGHDAEEDKKKKSFALKCFPKEEEKRERDEESEDDDLSLFTKKFTKFMRNEKFKGRSSHPSRRSSRASHIEDERREDRRQVICYECNKPGHIKPDCPLLKNKKKDKKKAMVATWTDNDEDSSNDERDEEVANMCFMALEDSNEVTLDHTYDELQDAFEELYDDFEKLGSKNILLKKKIQELQNDLEELKDRFSIVENSKETLHKENERLRNQNEDLIENFEESLLDENEKLRSENEALKKKNEWLTSSLKIFSCGQKGFDMMLASQKCVFDKTGLGYKSFQNQKYFKNYFVKASSSTSSTTICNFCDRNGHISSACPLKHGPPKLPKKPFKAKKVWVVKEKEANPQGPTNSMGT